MNYALYDNAGIVLSRGRCGKAADAEAMARRKGASVYWGHVPEGHIIVDGAPAPAPDAAPGEALKAELKAEIDTQAGIRRQAYITAVPGQEMVYAEKRAEAERILAGANDGVPHLAAEATAGGRTLAQQADIVLSMAAQWTTVSVAIETARLAAKAAIDEATTEGEARAVRASWPQM